MRQDAVRKEMLMKYVEDVLLPATAEKIAYVQTAGTSDAEVELWLVTMEDGEEYWLLEDGSPLGIYRRSGIYEEAQHVLDTYQLMREQEMTTEMADRFSYGYDK